MQSKAMECSVGADRTRFQKCHRQRLKPLPPISRAGPVVCLGVVAGYDWGLSGGEIGD